MIYPDVECGGKADKENSGPAIVMWWLRVEWTANRPENIIAAFSAIEGTKRTTEWPSAGVIKHVDDTWIDSSAVVLRLKDFYFCLF